MAANTQALKIRCAVVCLSGVSVVCMDILQVKRVSDMYAAILASVVVGFAISLAYLFPVFGVAKDVYFNVLFRLGFIGFFENFDKISRSHAVICFSSHSEAEFA